MSVSNSAAVVPTEVHPEIELTECPHCGAAEFSTEKRIAVVGKITVAIGAVAVLASLALTFLYIGLFTLIPSALLIWAGTLVQEDIHSCKDCGHEF